jgi:hypothetical protein
MTLLIQEPIEGHTITVWKIIVSYRATFVKVINFIFGAKASFFSAFFHPLPRPVPGQIKNALPFSGERFLFSYSAE